MQTWVLAYDADNNPERPLRCPVCSSSISKRNLEELVESTILEGEVEQLPEVEYEETEQGDGQ
jgi:DNA-binding HxlR family transcriptional regulator